MPSVGNIIWYSAVVAWSALIYQFLVKDLLTVSFGIGRVIQTIDEFPYSCSRIEHPQLEPCEDLWLDEQSRTLYTACAGTRSRMAWSPAISTLNATGRRPTGTDFIAIDIDSFSTTKPPSFRTIALKGSYGARGDAILDTIGFTGESIDDSTIHFYLTNVPPYHGSLFPASSTGANATVEVFSFKRGEEEMTHLRTLHTPAIWSPNRPAALGNGGFLVTNDHAVKVGWRNELEPLIGGGNIAFCPAEGEGECRAAVPAPGWDVRKNLKFPNGLARGTDGLIYVPSSADGTVTVFALQPNNTLIRVHTIPVGMPLDNISPDAKGDLWVPGFPNALQTFKGLANPYEEISPASVFRIRKETGVDGELKYEVKKMIEDKEGTVIDGATTVVHDVKSGKLWIGGAAAPFLVVCTPTA